MIGGTETDFWHQFHLFYWVLDENQFLGRPWGRRRAFASFDNSIFKTITSGERSLSFTIFANQKYSLTVNVIAKLCLRLLKFQVSDCTRFIWLSVGLLMLQLIFLLQMNSSFPISVLLLFCGPNIFLLQIISSFSFASVDPLFPLNYQLRRGQNTNASFALFTDLWNWND